jgi:putative membrane protein
LNDLVPFLPHVNASLNALATVLLVAGFVLIKRRRETAHKWTMLACFGVSVLFLASYLTYHYQLEGVSKKFPSYPPTAVRYTYYAILLTHVILAAAVPFLAIATIYLGLADKRRAHRRLAKWTFPIWLYVSVTGVIVYLMLYQLYPPQAP